MTIFSDYIHALLAMVQPLGLRGSVTIDGDRNDHPPAGAQNGLQSVEFTIPVRIEGNLDLTRGPGPLGDWLRQNTARILLESLRWQEIPPAMEMQLAQTIKQAVHTLQGLLVQENIALNQVWLDYAQTVFSVAWDAHQGKAASVNSRKQAKSQLANFELLCHQFVGHLQTQYESAKATSSYIAAPMQVTWDSHILATLPAHALTYIKLFIVGDERGNDKSLQTI